MATVWFWLLAFMICAYVVLDGFDLGVGALHRVIARTDAEREQAASLIGPVWDGNEVWLIAAAGVLFLGFPRAYAAAFSGLYFGLMIVLWLLVGRALGQGAAPPDRSPSMAGRLPRGPLAVIFTAWSSAPHPTRPPSARWAKRAGPVLPSGP